MATDGSTDFDIDLAAGNTITGTIVATDVDGVESTLNRTLDTINRCHTFEETIAAYELCMNK